MIERQNEINTPQQQKKKIKKTINKRLQTNIRYSDQKHNELPPYVCETILQHCTGQHNMCTDFRIFALLLLFFFTFFLLFYSYGWFRVNKTE